VLTPVLTSLLLAGSIDFEASAVAEARRGEVPVEPELPSHPATVSIITPSAGLVLHGHEGSLRLRYGPRLSWIQIDEAAPRTGRQPFVLHNLELSGALHSERERAFTARLSLTTGDTDYTALTQVLGRRQSQIPDITGFTSLLASAGVTDRFAPGWQIEATAEAFHRSTLTTSAASTRRPEPVFDPTAPPPPPPDEEPPAQAGVFTFPDDSGVTFTPVLSYNLDRQSILDLRSGLGYLWVNTGLAMATIAPALGWRYAFDRHGTFRASLGLVYAYTVSYPEATHDVLVPVVEESPRSSVTPTAEVAISADVYSSRDMVMTTAFNIGTTYYFDPVLASSGALGATGLQLSVAFPPRWTAGIDGYFATSLRKNPLPIVPEPDETVIGVSLPIRYRVSRNLNVEIGGRWSERAPHLRATQVEWRHREFWVYGAITGTFETGRPVATGGVPSRETATAPAERRTGPQPVSPRVESIPPELRPATPVDQRPTPTTDAPREPDQAAPPR
jgi:hypothetical protein